MTHEFRIPREIEIARTKESARFENNDEYNCPLCKGEYHMSEANGIPVRVCITHRVVLPIKQA